MEFNMQNNSDKEWQDFLIKVNVYAEDSSDKWTPYTLLAYFLVKYKDINGLDFVFSYGKKGPTKSRELKQAAVIWKMFDRGRYSKLETKEDKIEYKIQLVRILKEYINWAFNRFNQKQTNITGLGIFAVANFMNEFLQYRKAKENSLPTRNEELPIKFISWIENNAPSIWTKQQLSVLNDLNSLYNYVEAYALDKNSIESIVLEQARAMNLMPKIGRLELSKK